MNYITGIDRNQVMMQSMDENISEDNPVRVKDGLVESLGLKTTGLYQSYTIPKSV